jgi:hypothetical protein
MKYVKRSINEAVARDAALEIVYKAGKKGVTTGDLVAKVEVMLKPNFADRCPPSEGSQEPWQRAVYNIISHRGSSTSHIAAGFEMYSGPDSEGRLTITDEGKVAYRAMVKARQAAARANARQAANTEKMTAEVAQPKRSKNKR